MKEGSKERQLDNLTADGGDTHREGRRVEHLIWV